MSDTIKLLVIDDNEDDRLLYSRTLQKIGGFAITETSDGEEGLRLVAKQQPDCVLLDYSMPGRNGIEVLKCIRSQNPFVPVVMMTGQGSETLAVTAMQEGAQNYIAKAAITPQTLQHAVRSAIENCAMQKRIHEQRTSLEIFTRALAHDLKEPVGTIRSFIDLIIHQDQLTGKTKEYLDYIQQAADRMLKLIDTVYFYTRLDDAEHQAALELCDAGKVWEDVQQNLSELIQKSQAAITTDPLPRVHVNPTHLMLVLQNLLGNAIHHCEKTPQIHLSAALVKNQWVFRLEDNGPGIEPRHAERIFEPFARLARHKSNGLGLGLAICKKIIQTQGGKIWFESAPETGAAFLFTLPATPQLPADAEPPVKEFTHISTPAANGHSLANILLVEDNKADVELARIYLIEEPQMNCNLLVANDGYEALSLLKDEARQVKPVDLILLDINMPRMNGFELLEKMRQEQYLSNIPVIMCTTSNYDKDIQKAKSLGAIAYMTKPARIDKFESAVSNIASLHLAREKRGFSLVRTP
ncbi:MAG: response regulator [Dongiaceae bacterium]